MIALLAGLSWLLYRDPPEPEGTKTMAPAASLASVLRNRDLWLVAASTFIFAGMQTVWMAYLVLYLRDVVGMALITAARFLALAQLSRRGGARGVRSAVRPPLRRAAAHRARPGRAGLTVCTLLIAATGSGTSPWLLSALALAFGFVGIGWNGVQHTLLAELAGPRSSGTAVGLGLADLVV